MKKLNRRTNSRLYCTSGKMPGIYSRKKKASVIDVEKLLNHLYIESPHGSDGTAVQAWPLVTSYPRQTRACCSSNRLTFSYFHGISPWKTFFFRMPRLTDSASGMGWTGPAVLSLCCWDSSVALTSSTSAITFSKCKGKMARTRSSRTWWVCRFHLVFPSRTWAGLISLV